MEESVLMSIFGESPRMKIIDYLLEFPTNEFTPSDLVKSIGMSRTTVFREIKNLEEQKMINPVSKLGKSPTFRINLKNPIIKMIQQTIFLKSDSIADQQRAKRKVRTIVRASLASPAVIELWQKSLKEELAHTSEKLKTIHAT
ncbi:hypothetical protein [Nitrosopumilus sp.]|uniref:hypothetical protein n=1 Tax=Nitrosopumilus sp. TaxID=2024843 RepID=UPI00292D4191|nr:hypothetical protein [Nitrosopumilus sp.]